MRALQQKVATISVSFRTLHTTLSWMKSLTKQWNNKFEEKNRSGKNVDPEPEWAETFEESETGMVSWLSPGQNWAVGKPH